MGNSEEKLVIFEDGLRSVNEQLSQLGDVELGARIEVANTCAEVEQLAQKLNDLLGRMDEGSKEAHGRTMALALGLSECFTALSEVRKGNLDARVSDDVTQGDDEMLAAFGADLNLTLDELRDHLERQQQAIRTLSTPVLQIWDNVLALPIIGVVDSQRGIEIMERLLEEIVSKQARFVILDITGVDIVDTKTADYFLKIVCAAQLLGARCVVSGIQPAVAQTLVELGVDLASIVTVRNLRDALKLCVRPLTSTHGNATLARLQASEKER